MADLPYRIVIGLEVHVQLLTRTKLFCGCSTQFGLPPNSATCPVCIGMPGVLPVMNRRAFDLALRAALALNCQIAPFTKWDRKNYYYPDLPKNYQISQYDMPLCYEGCFDLIKKDGTTKTVRIRRAHLEEDAGKLLHDAPGGYAIDYSIVDLNRAGTPLLEIVTEPDLSGPEEVAVFGQELQKLVQFLGVSEGQMQMGHMRFEPNINVHITDESGQVFKTAITEVKNLNSFSVLERATAYEVQRQMRHWEETGELGRKSTYGWDEAAEATFLQRTKEEAHDYRYFPDPDLVPVEVSEEWLAEIRKQVGEMPAARRKRYIEVVGLTPAEAMILASDRATGDFYEKGLAKNGDAKRLANLLLTHGKRIANLRNRRLDELGISAEFFAAVADMTEKGLLNSVTAGQVLEADSARSRTASEVAAELGVLQVSDTSAIDAAIEAVLASNPKPLQDYRAGKASALGALVGLVMRNGRGLNPKIVQERLKEKV